MRADPESRAALAYPGLVRARWRFPRPAAPGLDRAGELASLQYLRGIAALMVAVYHAGHYLEVDRGDPALAGAGVLGLYGVSIFFAISGYLMAAIVRRTDPARFLAHRIVRIYPMVLGVVALYAIACRFTATPLPLDPLALTLAPAGPRFYALGVEWTLVFEVTFYVALFALGIAGRTRHLEAIAAAWLAILVALALWVPGWNAESLPPPYRLLLVPACTGFAAGLLIPAALRAGMVPAPTFALGTGIGVALTYLGHTMRWEVGLVAAVIVAGAVRAETRVARPALAPFRALGDWSYALYLCHVPVILVTYRIAPAGADTKALWAAALTGAVMLSAILGTVDVRLYRALKSVVDASRRGLLLAFVAVYTLVFAGVALYGGVHVFVEERRVAEVRALVDRLPGATLGDAAAARAALGPLGLAARPALRGDITHTQPLEGALLLRGWVADLDNPGRTLWIAVFRGGELAGLARPARFRPAVADALARPELARVRIGFGFATGKLRCAGAPVAVILVLDPTARTAAVLGEVPVPPCPAARAGRAG